MIYVHDAQKSVRNGRFSDSRRKCFTDNKGKFIKLSPVLASYRQGTTLDDFIAQEQVVKTKTYEILAMWTAMRWFVSRKKCFFTINREYFYDSSAVSCIRNGFHNNYRHVAPDGFMKLQPAFFIRNVFHDS